MAITCTTEEEAKRSIREDHRLSTVDVVVIVIDNTSTQRKKMKMLTTKRWTMGRRMNITVTKMLSLLGMTGVVATLNPHKTTRRRRHHSRRHLRATPRSTIARPITTAQVLVVLVEQEASKVSIAKSHTLEVQSAVAVQARQPSMAAVVQTRPTRRTSSLQRARSLTRMKTTRFLVFHTAGSKAGKITRRDSMEVAVDLVDLKVTNRTEPSSISTTRRKVLLVAIVGSLTSHRSKHLPSRDTGRRLQDRIQTYCIKDQRSRLRGT